MTLYDIQTAVEAGKIVHWSSDDYTVIKDSKSQWLIKHDNGNCIGLTWADGETLNGYPEEFYIDGEEDEDGEEPTPAPVQWEEGYFGIMDCHLPIKGIENPHSDWNGFRNPAFTLENVVIWCDYLWSNFSEMIPTEDGYYAQVVNGKVVEFEIDGGERINEGEVEPFEHNGQLYYSIGNYNLCWQRVELEEEYIEVFEALHKHRDAKGLTLRFDENDGIDAGTGHGMEYEMTIEGDGYILESFTFFDPQIGEDICQYVKDNTTFQTEIQINP